MVMMLALVLLFMLTGGASAQTSRRPWWEEFDTPAATEPTSSNAIPEALVVPLDLSKVCCECVPFYLCDSDNNIVTDGSTAIGPRIGAGNRVFNVENCPGDQQFCCKPKSAPPNCDMSQNPAPNPVPVDGEGGSCDCLHWELCPEGLRISDGSAPKIFLDGNISLPAHARCLGSFQVCCALDSEPEVSTPPSATNRLICVNPELCGADGNILAASMDLRNLAASARAPPCVSPMLACRMPADLDGTTTGPPVVPPSPPPVIVDQKCEGRRNPQGISVRIAGFNNSESQFGEFPWVGMILRTYFVADSPMNAFIGGAILVHPRIMLTAAHKVYKENVTNLHVRVGEWDIETDFEPGQHQGRAVESIVLHPLFNDKNLQHDVALVVLATPVTLQAHVRSICLARSLNDVQTNACVINGWGKNSFEGGSYQTVMKSLTLPLVAHNRCQSLLRETRLGYWFELHSSFICAGGELGKDACTSDGGGPLACPRRGAPNEYLLVGITAWGIGCGDQGVPGVYASTIADRSWITAEMERIAPDVIHTAVRRAVKTNGSRPWNISSSDLNKIHPLPLSGNRMTPTTRPHQGRRDFIFLNGRDRELDHLAPPRRQDRTLISQHDPENDREDIHSFNNLGTFTTTSTARVETTTAVPTTVSTSQPPRPGRENRRPRWWQQQERQRKQLLDLISELLQTRS